MMIAMRWIALFLLCLVTMARAHTVPSLTVEAVFQPDHSYTLRINVDPRLFLSDQPTSLPPVEADWYRTQSPDQVKQTEQRATDYLKKAIGLLFATKPTDLPAIHFKPMDGATNEPLKAESKEVHLLAEMQGTAAGADFQIVIHQAANSSVILLNCLGDQMERRPQVLFPGETSRPFAIEAKK